MPHEPQAALIPPALRVLCRVADLPEGQAKGFPPPPGRFSGFLAIRQGSTVRVYVNACPHIGTPLDWVPDRFMSADGTRLICATHGAEFRIEDGVCTRGPCLGDALDAVLIEIKDGLVLIPENAGA
ncbi:MAG TPA: Rieske 2Fe-2S domain-containing protein [Rhodopila sp.]|nr:Rieske 2Fe-2S domain-containing protein [Rhodopila sp.]